MNYRASRLRRAQDWLSGNWQLVIEYFLVISLFVIAAQIISQLTGEFDDSNYSVN